MSVDHLTRIAPGAASADGVTLDFMLLAIELLLCAAMILIALFRPNLVASAYSELPNLTDGENRDHR